MKSFIVIFALCLTGILADLTKKQKEILRPFKQMCIAETGLDEGVLAEARKGKIVEVDEKLSCFSACMFKKLGMLSQDGKLEEEVTRAIVTIQVAEDLVNKAIENCRNEAGKDECETAGKLVTCFMKNGVNLSI